MIHSNDSNSIMGNDRENNPLTAKDYGLVQALYPIGELIEKRITGGRTTTYSEVKRGRLKVVKRGKSTLVLTPDLVAYLNALRGGAV